MVSRCSELKVGADGDREARARSHVHNPLLVALAPPDLARSLEEVPHLFNRPVRHRRRSLSRVQRAVHHTAAARRRQQPDLGSIRRERVVLPWRVSCNPVLGSCPLPP